MEICGLLVCTRIMTVSRPTVVSDFLSRHMSLGFLRLGRRGGVGGCGGRRPPTGKGLQVSFVTPQLAL